MTTWHLSPHARHKIHRHLTLVFGNRLSYREKTLIGRQFYVNSGRNLADVIRMKKHFRSGILPLIEAEGMEHMAAAYKRGKGVVGVTGHIGNFELLAAYIQSQGYEVAVIGRQLYYPRLDHLLAENRASVGLTSVYTTDSAKFLVEWLRAGKSVGVLIDIDSSRVRGRHLPVFGRWGYTPVGQTILGLKCESAFLPMACLRTADHRYKVIVEPAVEVEPSGDTDRDVYSVTLACHHALERIILENPDQWPWLHNRWRTRRPQNLTSATKSPSLEADLRISTADHD